MHAISVLTIAHHRDAALSNLLKGLERATVLPAEVVVIFMNQDIPNLPQMAFPITAFKIERPGYLPLAAARNLAASKASNEQLVFLDVDCIPGPDFLKNYIISFDEEDLLWTGPVRYLEKDASTQIGIFDKLEQLSTTDKLRDMAIPISYELFWSLNFGCSKRVFRLIGGFDEAFEGYGGEDTDFAFSARKSRVKISWVNAVTYHQYHSSYNPPLNHLVDIVSNALKFKQKWDVWPMSGWLTKFKNMDLIDWGDKILTVKREPSASELAAALKL
jgi:GT2 family glycosyltransferase